MSLMPLDEDEKVSFRQKEVSNMCGLNVLMRLDPLSRSSFTSSASQTGRFHNADMLGTVLKTTCSKEKREKRDVHIHLCPPHGLQTISAALIWTKTIIPGASFPICLPSHHYLIFGYKHSDCAT